jgi:hypothetical protein
MGKGMGDGEEGVKKRRETRAGEDGKEKEEGEGVREGKEKE